MGRMTATVVYIVFMACAAGHAAARAMDHPQYLREPGSTTAVPAMDPPILDDTTVALVEYAKVQGMLDTLVTAAYAAADAAADAALHAAEATWPVAALSTDVASTDVMYEDALEQELLELDLLYDTYTSIDEILDEILYEELYDELRQEAAGTTNGAAGDMPRPSRRVLLQGTGPATNPDTTNPLATAPPSPTNPPVTPTGPVTPATPPAPTPALVTPATPTPTSTTTTTTPAPASTPIITPTPAPAPTATSTAATTTPTTSTNPTTTTTTSSPTSTAPADTADTTTGTTTDTATSSPATATPTTADTTPTPAPVSSPVVPAKATTVQPDETVPAVVQQEVATTSSQSDASFVLPSTEVTVAFVVVGINANDYETKYRQTVLNKVASISGTTADQWHSGTAEQSTSGRRLRQATDLKVDLKILTVNPNLVVYRLAKAPATAVNGCSSGVCAVLADAGVPIDKNSFLLGPAAIYTNLFGKADSGTAGNPDADALQQRRDLGKIVGCSVAGGIVLILLLVNYKRFIGCYRSRRAVSAQKKQLKQQQKLNGSAQGGNSVSNKSGLAPSKDVSSTNVIGDPIIKYATVERMPVIKSDCGVSDSCSSRISASGMHATPWASALAPQREVVEEVMPEEVPEVHYYQSQDLDEAVKDRTAFYLQRGNTLDDTESVDQGPISHPTAAAVPVYHADSDSFKIWADQSAAAAVAAADAPTGRRSPQRHTPASSSIVDMAARLPGSPIGSPLHSNPNSYGDLMNPQAHYPPVDPVAIQQTLTQLQNLMQQQQHMMAMMGSVAPGSGMAPRPAYDRVSNPGFQQGYGLKPEFVRQLSISAPGSRTGSPVFPSPEGTPVAAAGGFQRSGGFALKGVVFNSVGRLSKMDGSTSGASSRRIRAESQHGHQDMLATPFASPDLAPPNFK